MSRLTADVDGFRFFLSFGFAELIRIFLLIFFSFSVMLYYSIPRTLVTMAAMPFLIVVVFQFDKRVQPAFRRSEEHTSELQSRGHLVCRLLLEKKNIYI